jgi:two-component system cell cycle sensor histidine kinase/response regulator CckA
MTNQNEGITSVASTLFMLEQLSSAIHLGIMVSNLEGEIIYRNHAFETWIPDYQVENRLWVIQMQRFVEIGHATGFELKDVNVNWLLQNKIGMPTELEICRQRERLFFCIKYFPFLDDENRVCGIIEVTENITDHKETEKNLQHARRFETVGRLASGIAHDFNNILQVINGHSEMLMELRKDDARLTKSLDIILASGQKASALTRQLLLFSRRQQKEMKLINLGELLTGMEKILARMLGEDISLVFKCNDRDLCLEGDETQVTQIIMNLAINARDAMPEGGSITINVDLCEVDAATKSAFPYVQPGKYICMQFVDTGCGIPEELLDHVFEPFFTTKEAGRGTGLGLATIYGIVKQHQGYINISSKVNEGTAIEIYFPLSEDKRQGECVSTVAEAPQPGYQRSVLVVEDDENVRALANQVLKQYGYLVKCARNVAQAQQMAGLERFDLFLVDIVLPDGNGVDFVESLQGVNAGSAYVLSSGYTEDKLQIRKTLSKGYSFLQKPFTINSLLQACTEAMNTNQ